MILAFFIGLIGSVHCIGMCGPLMFALPNVRNSIQLQIRNQVLYHIGRIFTYGILGLIMGLIGATSLMKGWQQYLSIITGIFLIGFGTYHLLSRYLPISSNQSNMLMLPLLNKMSFWLKKPGGHFMVGTLNGLLPCGMVYLALASALNTGSATNGWLFMLMFGLGTLPLMLGASFIGHFFKNRLKIRFSGWLPFIFLVMGFWFILRGANLNIPYLSPLIYPETGNILCQ